MPITQCVARLVPYATATQMKRSTSSRTSLAMADEERSAADAETTAGEEEEEEENVEADA